MRALLFQNWGFRKNGLMDREQILEWAAGDREDGGLVQTVETEEDESVMVEIYASVTGRLTS